MSSTCSASTPQDAVFHGKLLRIPEPLQRRLACGYFWWYVIYMWHHIVSISSGVIFSPPLVCTSYPLSLPIIRHSFKDTTNQSVFRQRWVQCLCTGFLRIRGNVRRQFRRSVPQGLSLHTSSTTRRCSECVAGHFADSEGHSSCSQCSLGSVANFTGTFACHECSTSTFAIHTFNGI